MMVTMLTENTTKTVSIEYDEKDRVVKETTVVQVSTDQMSDLSAGEHRGRRLAVDADGYVWWVSEDGTCSMVRINPDNSPVPHPVTFYAPIGD